MRQAYIRDRTTLRPAGGTLPSNEIREIAPDAGRGAWGNVRDGRRPKTCTGTDTVHGRDIDKIARGSPPPIPVPPAYCFFIISISSSVVLETVRFSCLTM